MRASVDPTEWVAGATEIETPFVSVPGLLSAECVNGEQATYLQVTVHGDATDPRNGPTSTGDLTPQWGLHLVDMNLGMGNLLDIVRRQSEAWLGSR